MQYIETISETKYGQIWIVHSVLRHKKTILSFENGEFKIYNSSYLDDKRIKNIIRAPYIDLKKYKWRKLDLNCYEAIEYIYTLEWINMQTGRLKTYVIYLLVLFLSHLIFYTIWMYVWITLDDSTLWMIKDFINLWY